MSVIKQTQEGNKDRFKFCKALSLEILWSATISLDLKLISLHLKCIHGWGVWPAVPGCREDFESSLISRFFSFRLLFSPFSCYSPLLRFPFGTGTWPQETPILSVAAHRESISLHPRRTWAYGCFRGLFSSKICAVLNS